jgi:group I intron endonuclease
MKSLFEKSRPIKYIKIPATIISYKNLEDNLNVQNIRKQSALRGKGIIYGIENQLNNQIYIGSTTNWDKRIGNHLSYHKQSNFKLQNSIKEYGRSNFTLHIFIIVELATDLTINKKQKLLFPLEQDYIDLFPKNQLFNILLRTGSSLDHKYIEEKKFQIGISKKGRTYEGKTFLTRKNKNKKS